MTYQGSITLSFGENLNIERSKKVKSLNQSRSIVIVLILVVFCPFLATCASEELPGPLTVQVHSASDGKPVRSCTVHVGGRMAVSDPSGKIIFDGIPAGTYDMWCQHPGYQKF